MEFRNRTIEVNGFISVAFQQDASGRYILPLNQRDFIVESAFLKLYIAWETFLEKSCIEYMMGQLSINGTSITRYINPLDQDHAHKILLGTQRFVDWSTPDTVNKICLIFFGDTNPYNTYIGSITRDLLDLKTIRNSAAHLSSTTSSKLDALGSRILGTPHTGLTVSQLIFSADPTSTTGGTLLDAYITKLDIAAEGIAKA